MLVDLVAKAKCGRGPEPVFPVSFEIGLKNEPDEWWAMLNSRPRPPLNRSRFVRAGERRTILQAS
jgi:hypothetical protein